MTRSEPACPDIDAAELTEERDAYAAEAQALRRQLAEANAREIFLNNTIAQLRAALPNDQRHLPALAPQPTPV